MLMRCENCGAPQEFDQVTQVTECDYCGQNNFVQRPGETRTSSSPEHCPGCGYRLFGARTSTGFIWGCGHCGGVWLDLANCNQVANGSGTEVFEMAKRATSNARARGQDAKVPRACPVCEEKMAMSPVARGRFTVDACPQHGTFFDAGEIEAVHTYARDKQEAAKTGQPRVWNHTPTTAYELEAFQSALGKPSGDSDLGAILTGGAILLSLLAAGNNN
ncbi:MAG: zf-TFIIB domain-containing protein [Polyangiaceae bacterium]|nr:zf-TFIIB domain-containing protein [Polyangiaceae bacterium]MCB9607378.1 zf-TFIIB domain-containing protein [Polyangiaceae bacterium]